MSIVLVTGANGLLATHVIMELLTHGYFVTGLLRNRKKFQLPPHPHLKLVEGDFTQPQTFKEAVKGCDAVIHAAAITRQDLPKYAPYHRVNVMAVKEIMEASVAAHVKKVVHVSSANAFGYGTKEIPGDETRSIQKPFSESLYAQSKLEGQQVALSFKEKIKITVVNPTFMLGAYDAKPGSGKIILMGYGKKIIIHPPGGKNFVNATDAATGVIKALERGRSGECYLLSGQNLSYKAFFKKLAALSHQHSLFVKIPAIILLTAGLFGNLLKWMGIPSQLSLTNMKILCTNNFYSHQKATKELDLQFQPIEKGIEAGIDWFRKAGMIK